MFIYILYEHFLVVTRHIPPVVLDLQTSAWLTLTLWFQAFTSKNRHLIKLESNNSSLFPKTNQTVQHDEASSPVHAVPFNIVLRLSTVQIRMQNTKPAK